MQASAPILVVEDEPSIAETISYALKTEGFEPTVVQTAAEARSALDSCRFQLVILDIGLPDAHGFDFYRELQSKIELPVIFLTARSDEIDRVSGLELGADDYVVKPFSPRELTARVRAVLRRVRKSGSHAKSEEIFQVNELKKQISFYGTVLELSRYEYRLLKVFVASPGRVFTRDQLMGLVWEQPEMSLERTVDTHVKTLRQKLKEVNGEVQTIITHRGLGYSLNEEM